MFVVHLSKRLSIESGAPPALAVVVAVKIFKTITVELYLLYMKYFLDWVN